MKRFNFLFASLAVLSLCGAASAQCLAPGTESFDSLPASSTSYGIASPAILPAGWTHDLIGAVNSWRVDFGGTGYRPPDRRASLALCPSGSAQHGSPRMPDPEGSRRQLS